MTKLSHVCVDTSCITKLCHVCDVSHIYTAERGTRFFCNTLQLTATQIYTWNMTPSHASHDSFARVTWWVHLLPWQVKDVLQHNTLQHTATRYNTLQHIKTCSYHTILTKWQLCQTWQVENVPIMYDITLCSSMYDRAQSCVWHVTYIYSIYIYRWKRYPSCLT